MKKMKSLFVAIMLFVGATSFVNAQTKIAHIDTQALAESMPEMKAAQSQLENLQRTYDTEIKTLVKEFETKIKQYDVEGESKTAEVHAKRAPILEKARTAIEKVGRSQGYQYVLDSSSLLLAEGKDLLVDVKKELGI